MPSRAYTSFLQNIDDIASEVRVEVSMPSRAYTSFLPWLQTKLHEHNESVSMPSRAYTSFLREGVIMSIITEERCQCPLGLIPHFYGTPSKT